MSYQVFARKWRPKNFSDVAGQQHVLKALSHSFELERIHHAYLFTGTRGVGKTTLARIIAKCLNCEHGLTSEPCGQCESCKAIEHGHYIDLIEVDAASKTKVEDTRNLLENVPFSPSSGRYKVYLIDEVHMLSGHSFNALLKTLEEPPEHVVFILATTEPEKLPITILSRCLKLHLKHLSESEIETQIEKILTTEAIEFETAAVKIISRAAKGSMRDALSLLEQANMMGAGKVYESDVSAMLGLVDNALMNSLLKAITEKNYNETMTIVETISEFTDDYQMILNQMVEVLTTLALEQAAANINDFSDYDDGLGLTPEQLQLLYQIALLGQKDMAIAPVQKSAFEMLLLRLMLFEPAGSAPISQAAAPPTQVEQTPESKPALTQQTVVKEQIQAKAQQDQRTAQTTPVQNVQANTVTTSVIHEDDKQWSNTVLKLNLTGIAKVIVSQCQFESKEDERVSLNLAGQYALMLTDHIHAQIQQELSNFYNTNINLTINTAVAKKQESASSRVGAQTPQQLWDKKATITAENNSSLQSVIDKFDGKITNLELKDKHVN